MESEWQKIWREACDENPPRPDGAAGTLLSMFAKKINVNLVQYESLPKAAVFLFDLSSLGFAGMDLNVVIVTHPAATQQERIRIEDLTREYRKSVDSYGFCFHLILSAGEASSSADQSEENIVVVRGGDLNEIFEAQVASSALFGLIFRQIPFTHHCPYSTTHAARGGMFFNRKTNLRKLVYDTNNNYCVTGARRLGKSSLLLRAFEQLKRMKGNGDRVFYFDCRTWGNLNDCTRRILQRLTPKEERRAGLSQKNFLRAVRRESQSRGAPLTFFFDELDRVVESDSKDRWEFFELLADLAENDNSVRVIFAGYRAMSNLYSNTFSPFYEKLEKVRVSAFTRSFSDQLISKPMANIEVEIESGKILERIWANTLGYPFMVQYFGRRLFEQIANSSLKKIDLHNVKEIEDDDETLSFLFTHFLYNTQDESGNQSSAERQCCALLANSVLLPIDDSAVTEQQIQFDPSFEGWTDMDFHTKSLSIGHPLNHLEIDEAIRNLCNAAILMRRQGKYHFALPLLPKVLKQRYPDLNSFVDSLY